MIDTANSGILALQMIKDGLREGQHSYGLILMDCSMPIMDGYETTDKLRRYYEKHNIDQPMIVACTSHTEP